MKRLGGIWYQLLSFENLLAAYLKARRGKGQKPGVAEFGLDLEHELLALQRELASGEYRPGPYRLFSIYEGKPRVIAAAPFRDRVVHHAVMNLIEPPLDRALIFDSYACRSGKGVHAAVDRYQRWARRYTYAMKLDVQRYFPSIDHDRLKEKLHRRIKDRATLELLELIINRSPTTPTALRYFPGDDLFTPLERRTGIPIGNLTSQFFANLFLDDLDHYVKESLGVRAYLRYVDDMVLLDDDKVRLAELRAAVREYLCSERLWLHPRKAHVTRVADGLNLLGYVIYPHPRRLANHNGYRFARRLRRFAQSYAEGRMSWSDIDPSVQSWIGHARHADTSGLRSAIFGATVFQRGTGRESACGWCAAVPGTTIRGTCAHRTGTGTGRATATTTLGSVSPSPPVRLRAGPGAGSSRDGPGVVHGCP